jgi:hypothetical protein
MKGTFVYRLTLLLSILGGILCALMVDVIFSAELSLSQKKASLVQTEIQRLEATKDAQMQQMMDQRFAASLIKNQADDAERSARHAADRPALRPVETQTEKAARLLHDQRLQEQDDVARHALTGQLEREVFQENALRAAQDARKPYDLRPPRTWRESPAAGLYGSSCSHLYCPGISHFHSHHSFHSGRSRGRR